jgi:ferrous-iron efflux pump FieF
VSAAPALAADPLPREQAARLMRRAASASLAVAGALIALKAMAWFATDSVAVLSSLLDSLLDLAASAVNFLAVRHAATPADAEHRFGHGKAEPLAGLAQAAFITGSALLLLIEALHRFAVPQAVVRPELGIGVSLLSIAASVALVLYQRHVVARTGSVAIAADSLHYTGDILLNGSVIAAILLAGWLRLPLVDPLFGAAIALWITRSAWQIGRASLDRLMDRELPDAERERILAIARAHPEVRGVHDLRTRSAGTQVFIQLHLDLDGAISLSRAHRIADEVEERILAAFPNAEVITHEDVAGVVEARRDAVGA